MPAVNPRDQKVVIIGGGPAGLTAAYQLSKVGAKSVVLEKDAILGGISRTVEYKGYHFDIGGHRFFHEGFRRGQDVERGASRGRLPALPAVVQDLL